MKKDFLMWQMAIFFLIVFTVLGLIVVNDKKVDIMLPKIDKKLNTYISDNYKNLKDISISKTTYENKSFKKTVSNKDNKNLYFTVTYKNKEITDTYKKDYLEGHTILKYHEDRLNKELISKYKASFLTTYNEFTDAVKEKLLTTKDIKDLSIYNITVKDSIDLRETDITSYIINTNNYFNQLSYFPKNYTFILTDKTDLTYALEISNINKNNLVSIKEIINSILKNDKSIETKYNISYKYLN